jgi:hypothetical protein
MNRPMIQRRFLLNLMITVGLGLNPTPIFASDTIQSIWRWESWNWFRTPRVPTPTNQLHSAPQAGYYPTMWRSWGVANPIQGSIVIAPQDGGTIQPFAADPIPAPAAPAKLPIAPKEVKPAVPSSAPAKEIKSMSYLFKSK